MSKSELEYGKPYCYSPQDGTTLSRMFDNLRLGRDLRLGLVPINIYSWPKSAFSEYLGEAWVKIEGIHQRGNSGRM